jgi:CheY-like chemotaxis protein
MTGKILFVDGRRPRRWCVAKAMGWPGHVSGRIADILFGDFDRDRAEATVAVLKRSLPANELHVVRSGCEALAFLRQRGLQPDPEQPPRPILALLDEDLSGMAGHSILRSMLKLPLPGGRTIILLVGTGRVIVHRQWVPEPDGYLVKPFAFHKLRACLGSFGEAESYARIPLLELPA